MFQKTIIIIILLSFQTVCIAKSIKIPEKVTNLNFDLTDEFKLALNSNVDTIIIKSSVEDYFLDPITLFNIYNKTIIFEDSVSLRAKPGAFKKNNDVLFKFINSNNIIIIGNNGELSMNKKEYTNGEWRNAISLLGCNNVYIEKLHIKDSGGDGIYIAGSSTRSFSSNIHLNTIICQNNKRQGLSIISAEHVVIENSIFCDTKGALPEAGIDIEPNSEHDRVVDINFNNCIFEKNGHSGILLALSKLNFNSIPVSVTFNDCVISNNHRPENPYAKAELVFAAKKENPVKGHVKFNKCLVKDSDWSFFYSRKTSSAYSVTFKDCIVNNVSRHEKSAVINLEVPDYYKETDFLGGYYFDNLQLEYYTQAPYLRIRGSHLNTLKGISNIKGTINLISNTPKEIEYINYEEKNNKDVDIRLNYIFSSH
ncbi:right-handed parallel beta-helix repeat-containing protein [Cellulophaga sp. Ld12]|uniref:right-handed parallel beta-helix repeat-containing protein n=1 Tax=Cellulophaga sp. Ld12 TaxID=3229535 RepID=UPI0038684B53